MRVTIRATVRVGGRSHCTGGKSGLEPSCKHHTWSSVSPHIPYISTHPSDCPDCPHPIYPIGSALHRTDAVHDLQYALLCHGLPHNLYVVAKLSSRTYAKFSLLNGTLAYQNFYLPAYQKFCLLTFADQNFCLPEFLLTRTLLTKTFACKSEFLLTRIFAYQNFCLPEFLLTRIFAYQNFCLPELLLVNQNFCLPEFLLTRIFAYQNFCLPELLLTRTFACRSEFLLTIIFAYQNFCL